MDDPSKLRTTLGNLKRKVRAPQTWFAHQGNRLVAKFRGQKISRTTPESGVEQTSHSGDKHMDEGLAAANRKCQELNAASTAGVFQYEGALERGWIRLLQLHPGKGSDPIICSLSPSFIGKAHIRDKQHLEPFEAVSYVWGAKTEDDPKITVNWRLLTSDDDGHILFVYPMHVWDNLKVTKNLFHLLHHLRREDDVRWLWIDQICLNQSDEAEKSVQVRVMSEIYSAAQNVLIWLGESDLNTRAAFGVMDWLAATTDMVERDMASYIEFLLRGNFAQNESDVSPERLRLWDSHRALLEHVEPRIVDTQDDLDHPNHRVIALLGIRKLNGLLSRAWFSRAWTFQETVSAQQATIQCGDHIRSWNTLHAACSTFMLRHIHQVDSLGLNSPAHIAKAILQQERYRQNWARISLLQPGVTIDTPGREEAAAWFDAGGAEQFLNERRIKALLPILRDRACRKPHDKVLALFGCAHDGNTQFVFPDYRQPVKNLYLAIVNYWITDVKMDLEFLSHVQRSQPEHELPSWVPDWSCPPVSVPLVTIESFCASANSIADVGTNDFDLLDEHILDGVIPRIEIDALPVMIVQDVDVDRKAYSRHARMLESCKNRYPTTDMTYPDVYEVIFDHANPAAVRAPRRSKMSQSFWQYTSTFGEQDQCMPAGQPVTSEGLAALDHGERPLHRVTGGDFVAAIAPGRAFFVSNTGFIGFLPSNAREGDEIYVFKGARVPFVVRRIVGRNFALPGKYFTFIGECFVYGIMHGEVMEDLPDVSELITLI